MCPGHWGAERTDTRLPGKTGFFRKGKVELGLEDEFVHPMIKREGSALHSRGDSIGKGRKEVSILGEKGFPKYGWTLGCQVGNSPKK